MYDRAEEQKMQIDHMVSSPSCYDPDTYNVDPSPYGKSNESGDYAELPVPEEVLRTPGSQQIRLKPKQIVNDQSYSNSIGVAPFNAGLDSQAENEQTVHNDQDYTVTEGIVNTDIVESHRENVDESTEQANRTFEEIRHGPFSK